MQHTIFTWFLSNQGEETAATESEVASADQEQDHSNEDAPAAKGEQPSDFSEDSSEDQNEDDEDEPEADLEAEDEENEVADLPEEEDPSELEGCCSVTFFLLVNRIS